MSKLKGKKVWARANKSGSLLRNFTDAVLIFDSAKSATKQDNSHTYPYLIELTITKVYELSKELIEKEI